MTLPEVRAQAIVPALALLLARMNSPQAEIMILAIGLQESRFTHRRQVRGPARGFWPFEQGGGVAGVLRNPVSRQHALSVCAARGVQPMAEQVHERLEHDDVLAATFARLLLWTDPGKLPSKGDVDAAWQLCLRTWRPGAHSRGNQAQKDELRAKWGRNYAAAERAVYP